MSDFIDRVRDNSNIEEIAGSLTQLSGKADRLIGLCPFHSEDTPSFTVFPEQNSWHCFGCHRGGSVFDLVMERDSCTFWDAAVTLANKAGIPLPEMTEEEKEKTVRRQSVEDMLTNYATGCHKNLLKHPEVIEYLHSRGVTDESIESYQIGLGVALPKSGIDKDIAKEAGITDTRLVGRITFPIKRAGKVVQISARTLKDEKPKYLNLARELYPFNSHRMRGGRVLLVEGVLDTILLEQAGFTATGTGTHFKQDWLKLVGRETNCYCAYDQDDSGAGETANNKIADMLFGSGHKAFVAVLPKGHDPASLIQTEGAGAVQDAVDKALPYIDYLIERLPANLNGYELPKRLEAIFNKLAVMPESGQERYITKLATKIKLPKAGVRNDLKNYIKSIKARADHEEESVDDYAILRRETNPIWFNPAQDVIGSTLYYTIYMQTQSKAFMPFVITSDRAVFRLTKEELLNRDFTVANNAIPTNEGRWSIGSQDKYNVYDFIDGKTHIDPNELFEKIKWYFTKYLRLPDDAYYDFLPLWVIATYHFRLYDAFGYLFLNAIKGSGKTQALTIISWLAFNADQADDITEAGLKRLVNANAATLLHDEAEKLCKKKEDSESTIFEVWNGGYKKTGRAISVNKETHNVEKFWTYSPKALANTRGLDNVLEDRCITLYFEKDIGKIPQLTQEEHLKRIGVLRNMLYCFSLEYIGDIAEAKSQTKRPDGLSGRDWELWQAVIVLAKFMDSFRTDQPSLYDSMVKMAIERRNYKAERENEMNPQPRILGAIWEYIQQNPSHDDTYQSAELCAAIKEELGWEKYNTVALSRFIFEEAHIAKSRKTDRIKRRTTSGPRWFYKIDPNLVIERARKMFGIDLRPEEDVERNPFDDDDDD